MTSSTAPVAKAGQAKSDVGLVGKNRFTVVASDFFGALSAMASYDLRQPLRVTAGTFDMLARLPRPAARRMRPARFDYATMQVRDKLERPVDALRPCRFSTDDRGPRPVGRTLDQPVSASGRQVAAAWLVCVVIAALAVRAASGPHDREVPVTALAYHGTIVVPDTGCPPAPLPCARGDTASREPW